MAQGNYKLLRLMTLKIAFMFDTNDVYFYQRAVLEQNQLRVEVIILFTGISTKEMTSEILLQ